ncbi:hypothetical protein ALC62_05103 [Cyphomyrmex costatus]|uniref:CCDC113/CCDC96 coiled-coil domain-containing protein n=1 Tax=Cyphomyrmex costatus TaxID=456900 RepID=A0A195CUY8_9HYME|nr:hypothetical protein ALC62_05103 [Cyphomyrmex costatus]
MTERMTENDANGFVDEDNEERLYLNTVISDDRESSASQNEEYKDERTEEKEDVYKTDDFFIWDEEQPGEREYEEEGYEEEQSLEDEEAEEGDAPSEDIATISTAEEPEEEVQRDVVGPDHVLAEIPAEMQEKVTPVDTTKESEQMEQIYRQTLHTYKQYLDDVTERKIRIAADMQSYEDRVQETRDENAGVFDELLDREREVATGLIYAKTGRMLTEKAVNEITRRQVSRREILARNRYEYILLQHRLDETKLQLRNLETLGEGMTSMDYEALRIAHVNYKDKLDERDRELEKWRNKALLTACCWQIEIRIAEMVNGVAHYKEKETCLAEDIEFEERELNEYCEQTTRVREDVNKLHLILRDLRWAHDEKRLEGGLLLAPPVLRETERKMKLLDAVRNDIEIIKREIHRYGPANGRKKKTSSKALAMSTMTQEKPDRF